MSVLIETSVGDIVIDVYTDYAPRTSWNFLKLCCYHYYNDLLVFSITPNLLRTGCPKNNGTAGRSIQSLTTPPGRPYIPHEFHPKLNHDTKGTVSMISGGPKVGNGSQFMITLRDNLDHLDERHTVFGFVVEGYDTLDRIAKMFVDDENRPLRNIRLRHTIVLHDPFPPVKGLGSPPPSPRPLSDDNEAELEGDLVESERREGLNEEERENEEIRRREASSRAEVLEMIGDIKHAHLAPPENVLFVCKLNPVTTSGDLDTVFSRFGECKADVKRDREGQSLCYAFVEFTKKEACEKAYFAMDGVIIDDRRIKVDFSQSTSSRGAAFNKSKC